MTKAGSLIGLAGPLLEEPVEVAENRRVDRCGCLHLEEGEHATWRLLPDVDLSGSVAPVIQIQRRFRNGSDFSSSQNTKLSGYGLTRGIGTDPKLAASSPRNAVAQPVSMKCNFGD